MRTTTRRDCSRRMDAIDDDDIILILVSLYDDPEAAWDADTDDARPTTRSIEPRRVPNRRFSVVRQTLTQQLSRAVSLLALSMDGKYPLVTSYKSELTMGVDLDKMRVRSG